MVITRQTNINKVNVMPFLKFMKRPHTKYHADTMRDFKVVRSKKVKTFR